MATKKEPMMKSASTRSAEPKAAPAKKATPASRATASSKTPAKKQAAKDLAALFEDGLKDLYWAEKALSKELPKMEKNATSPDLKKGIKDHLAQTKGHIDRLENCFALIGKRAVGKKCEAMDGLLKEGKSIIEDTQIGNVRDAGIIAAAQKVEHYEIASYGTMAAWAKTLGEVKCLKLLLSTLEEEIVCDKLLTSIADGRLNVKAK